MIRVATLDDAGELLEVCNNHELRVDPDFEAMPLSEITEFLNGYEEPAHAAEKGYKSVGLGVDTGNESGALQLYENQGFRPTVVWRGYATTI
jgi:hypothetical protein